MPEYICWALDVMGNKLITQKVASLLLVYSACLVFTILSGVFAYLSLMYSFAV